MQKVIFSIAVGIHIVILFVLTGVLNYDKMLLTPREGHLLWSLLFSPLIHLDYNHLCNNLQLMIPCLLLVYFIVKEKIFILYPILYVATTLLLWCLGSPGIHIGISGVVLSLLFFILASGLFSFNRTYMVLSVIIFLWQLFLLQNFWKEADGVSSDAHFIGALVGSTAGYLYWNPFKNAFSG